jgi:hypothetical protein
MKKFEKVIQTIDEGRDGGQDVILSGEKWFMTSFQTTFVNV